MAMVRIQRLTLVVLAVVLAGAFHFVLAQQARPGPMSFFITSVGIGDGANLGGLAGADAHCQSLASAVGRGELTWRAYLSTQGPNAVNARDRIGSGPWYAHGGRRRIALDVAELHGADPGSRRRTLPTGGDGEAQLGNALGKTVSLTEQGTVVNGVGDSPNQHQILTGTRPDGSAFTDGMDHTCANWTSNGEGSAQVGHSDKQGGNGSWNSAQASRGCSQEDLEATGGAGLFYCFAVD